MQNTILTASNAVHNLEYICLLTCTCKSISSKASVARTVVISNCVFASCIWITTVQTSFTLWNVCNKALKSNHSSKQCCVVLYTCTVESIAFKAFPTCAVKASIYVGAVGIETACMHLQFTLIDICQNQS